MSTGGREASKKGCPCPSINPPEPPNGVEYDASAIQVLEGLEAVRKRPGMYIGSTGERGLHHLIWEIVDNAVDEALAGYCDRIVLTLTADGAVRVEDNGRGIPTDTAPGQELPAVTIALTQLHAGGKFGGGGYKVSGGLHGVGVSVVNALSTHLIAEVKNRGHLWRQSFTHGVPDGDLEDVRELEPGEGTGTTITYWPSPDTFETTTHSLETITSHIREYAFLNKGLEIVVRDERPEADDLVEAVQDETIDNDVDQAGHRRHQARRAGRPRAGLQVRPRAGRLRRAPQPPQAAGQPHDHLLRGRDARQRRATT